MIAGKILFYFCWLVLAASGLYGFAAQGFTMQLIIFAISALAWLVIPRTFSSICFFISIITAVTGFLTGVSSVMMFIYTGCALALWDMNSLILFIVDNAKSRSNAPYLKLRLTATGLTLAAWVSVTALFRSLDLRIPFFLLLFFVVVLFLLFDRLLRVILKPE